MVQPQTNSYGLGMYITWIMTEMQITSSTVNTHQEKGQVVAHTSVTMICINVTMTIDTVNTWEAKAQNQVDGSRS